MILKSGRIVFGGEDIREYGSRSAAREISMVFQDVYLFKDTIGNIRFGREGATFAEVSEGAARKACCHEFIMKLPMGYDTPGGFRKT